MAVKTEGWGVTATPGEIRVCKGFLQSEVLGEVGVLEGRRSGRSFGEVWDEVFGEVFGLVLLQHSEQKEEDFRKKLQPEIPNWQKFRGKLHDQVLQGDPRGWCPSDLVLCLCCKGQRSLCIFVRKPRVPGWKALWNGIALGDTLAGAPCLARSAWSRIQ